MDSSQPKNHQAHSPLHHPHPHHHPCLYPPPHHHHYHLHFSPHCPLHSRLLQPHIHPHPHPCPCPSSIPFLNPSELQVPVCAETYPSDAMMIEEGNEVAFEEDEEEPVFVLTDEWREFFAKSEAKRRLAKKQARNKGKAEAG